MILSSDVLISLLKRCCSNILWDLYAMIEPASTTPTKNHFCCRPRTVFIHIESMLFLVFQAKSLLFACILIGLMSCFVELLLVKHFHLSKRTTFLVYLEIICNSIDFYIFQGRHFIVHLLVSLYSMYLDLL